ncbi:AN1 family Zinc finger domain-containing protein [Besnoitia besnoiti]|uniref:AN1 family Zinc finger domain-containing protein n=1 Tax=Besnoitia besnoiti TaxID=94643 RepID=A0A2A9MI70_BESBE|nr:AN1 family Zinc finger domain-containing protein [Besnoitia besnoiti]PFH35951.1 AN1 family Zinc finger domain-containing protein [Besnoitia besnoiti]
MAAFSDKGDVCSEPLCGMRDFLPFNCNKCGSVFCVDHFVPERHNCPRVRSGDRRVYVCPTCLEAVPMANEEAEASAAQRHRPTCQPEKYEERRRQLKGSTCPIKCCRERLTDITTYHCKACDQDICLKHRLQEDHDCQRVQQARKEKQHRARSFRLFKSNSSEKTTQQVKPGRNALCSARGSEATQAPKQQTMEPTRFHSCRRHREKGRDAVAREGADTA